MTRTVEKLAAVCFLDAVKQVMEQLAERKLQVGRAEDAEGRALIEAYQRARRLRDHLQRRAGSFQEAVQIELDREDQAMLVACCRHFVQHLEARLERAGNELSRNDRSWIQHRSELLAKWTVELAEAPACVLPLPKQGHGKSPVFRGMEAMLQAKLHSPQVPGTLQPDVGSEVDEPQPPDPWRKQVVRATDPAKPIRVIATGIRSSAQTVEPPAASTAGGSSDRAPDIRPMLAQSPQQLRDPRLRNSMSLDLRSYRRAQADNDLRAAALLLTILLETAIVDHALVRGEELGLGKSPEGWSFLDLLKAAIGTPVTPRVRVLAHQLVAARNLSRPAMQLLAPHAVTSASLDSMEEFVCQLLRNMGFSEQQPTAVEPGEPERIRGDGLDRFL